MNGMIFKNAFNSLVVSEGKLNSNDKYVSGKDINIVGKGENILMGIGMYLNPKKQYEVTIREVKEYD